MPKIEVELDPKNWTYGAEHELADWDTRKGWEGYGRDPEPNICNSNGIAADPSLKSYPFGAEINTPPSSQIETQADYLEKFLKLHPKATVNYRTGMHIHIRVPGLSKSLKHLKTVQKFITDNSAIYQKIDPIEVPTNPEDFESLEEYRGARKRAIWMRMAHHTVIPIGRVEAQLGAKTLDEFFEAEVPRSRTGVPLWHAQPRAAINLRQLKQTDTIEFRHFVGTLDPEKVLSAVEWCRGYLLLALTNGSVEGLWQRFSKRSLPRLSEFPYSHWMELRWRATTISKRPRPEVDDNIRKILRGQFDTSPNFAHLNPIDYASPDVDPVGGGLI